MSARPEPAVWLPAIRAGSGTDVFTEHLADGLNTLGVRAEISWLPRRAEYAPWSVPVPHPPAWANIAHVNTWLPERFVPLGLPLVATLHLCVQDKALSPYKSPLQRLYHRVWVTPMERRMIGRAARVTAVSRYTAGRAGDFFGRADIDVIPNGIDMDLFRPQAETRASNVPFRLLFVGNWSRRKGAELLGPILQALGPAFELWIVAGLRGPRRVPQLPTNVRLLPTPPNQSVLADLYRAADVLLFPTRLEGFGLVAVEAQACGLPVIATRCSSLPEVVQDESTGILCPENDVEQFVAAARRLAEDADLRNRMQAAARTYAVERFALHGMITRYSSLYQAILSHEPLMKAPRR